MSERLRIDQENEGIRNHLRHPEGVTQHSPGSLGSASAAWVKDESPVMNPGGVAQMGWSSEPNT